INPTQDSVLGRGRTRECRVRATRDLHAAASKAGAAPVIRDRTGFGTTSGRCRRLISQAALAGAEAAAAATLPEALEVATAIFRRRRELDRSARREGPAACWSRRVSAAGWGAGARGVAAGRARGARRR